MNNDEFKTLDEVIEEVTKQGIPLGSWQNQNPKGDAEAFTIPSFTKLADGLKNLSSLIEKQIGEDQQMIGDLNMKLNRLRHGGGR